MLSNNEMYIDAIVEVLSWGFSKIAKELLQDEFKGLILSLPGKMYKKNIQNFLLFRKILYICRNF